MKRYPIYVKMLREMYGLNHKIGDIIGMSNVELAQEYISKGYAELSN